jgi:3-hydroxyacyl-[acyl-carrier-protein] dehydratase
MSERCFVWEVPFDHPAFEGHFPGRPIVPGVVLLDRVMVFAQALAGDAAAAWTVSQAKFLSPVGPGELVAFEMTANAVGGWRFAARVGDRDVASGSLAPQAA